MEFENNNGEIVSSTYTILMEESRIDPTQSAFANVLHRLFDNQNTQTHFQLCEDLKNHLFT